MEFRIACENFSFVFTKVDILFLLWYNVPENTFKEGNPMVRIEALRDAALNKRHSNDEFFYLFYKRYSECEGTSEYERYSEAYYYAFSNLTPHITDGELIVGETSGSFPEEQVAEWEVKYKEICKSRCSKAGGGQDSHMAVDYELLLNCGIRGVIDRINGYLAKCDDAKKEFYKAAKKCLLAVIKHSESYALCAEEMAKKEIDEKRRIELLKISEMCKKVPASPSESFYEAVQAVHFLSYCLSLNPLRYCAQQFQLGHPDRYLYPYYVKDVNNGRITKAEAQELLDCLGVQINMRVPRGLSSGYMVGGRDKDGQVVANELTGMLMDVVDNVRLVYPAVGLCYTDDMPEKYIDRAVELLARGRSHPAIFNDDIIAKGLESYGVPKEECHDYIHSTCVEITPTASSNVWVASPYTNMAQLLLDTMDREYESFDKHLDEIFLRLDGIIERNFMEQNNHRSVRLENSMNPLLSCFVNDCLKRGLDIERGGARYNWIMPSFVGMANLVDSLFALKKAVYEEKRLGLCDLKKILEDNFEGNEELRRYLLESLPKYGNDIDEVDSYFGIITKHITEECKKYRAIHSSGNLIPSVFCWVMHEYFGRNTGATPDGRYAGFPLGDGSGPCQGREMSGPTASILSSTKWAHSELIGGIAVNMKFSKSSLGDSSPDTMKSLIKAFILRGGFEIQINVTDRSLLLEARQNPEEHRDLVVRIGGYSDYFTRLSPQMQDEVILRTEHKI